MGEFGAYHIDSIVQMCKVWNQKRGRWQLFTLSADKSLLVYDLKLPTQQVPISSMHH